MQNVYNVIGAYVLLLGQKDGKGSNNSNFFPFCCQSLPFTPLFRPLAPKIVYNESFMV